MTRVWFPAGILIFVFATIIKLTVGPIQVTVPTLLKWLTHALSNQSHPSSDKYLVHHAPHPYLSFIHNMEWDQVHFVLQQLVGLLYRPQMIDEYGSFSKMIIGMGNWGTLTKPVPVPFCPPQIMHDPESATAGSQWLTAWAMAQPCLHSYSLFKT
jgi:hypothetical protein